MKMFSAVCVIAVLAASSSSSNGFAADSFDQSIRPLLRDYCVTCHSTEKQEGELDLDRRTAKSFRRTLRPVVA